MMIIGKFMWRVAATTVLVLSGPLSAAPGDVSNNPPPPRPTTPNTGASTGQFPAPPPTLNGPNAPRPAQPAAPAPSANRPATNAGDPAATASAGCNAVGDQLCLNFQNAEIQGVVKAISQLTGRNFLLDPRVKGQITIISAKPVSRYAAYQIFLSALKAQGFTAVEGPGPIVKVIPTGEAKMSAEVYKDIPRGGEHITTHVAVLQHVSATQMVPLLRPLMAPTSQLSAYESANALIITDYADNIRRLLDIVERVDQPISSDVTVVPLKHASALDLSELITRLASSAGGAPGAPHQPMPGAVVAGDRFTIVPDLRTNSLLVRTDNPGRLNQLRSLIDKLDVPATTGGQTRVIYLRNAEATKLAEVLRGLLAGEARTQQATAPAAAGAAVPISTRSAGGRGTADASLIQADEATNSLIINAPDSVYNNLRAVIEKLDVRRAQVFVEALIAEISTDNASELGIQWADAARAGKGAVAGITNFPTSRQQGLGAVALSGPQALAGASGLTLAFLGPKIKLSDGTEVQTLGALARALEQRSLANILSTPNLMTLDNAEASIHVGQNVPFLTGSFSLPTGGAANSTVVNPFQTVERKDVGIKLKIKPQISEGGGVKLDIAQEISTVTNDAASFGAADLITNKRTVETKVLVDDGNTVVLGGLIEDRIRETRQQVPLLGRIPLLGALFRSTESRKEKTNLMIFLRPTILRTVDDGYNVTADRYGHIRAVSKEKDKERAQILQRFEPAPPKPKEAPAESKPKTEQKEYFTPVPSDG